MIMARNQVQLDIERREPFAGGSSFGDTGPYERLYGKAHFAIDPDEKGLPSIVDLDLAPRNAQGLVEFAATLDIIKPVELSRGNRRIFYEFSNRGNRGLLGFNYGRGMDMSTPEYAGDGFLMRQGYTLLWSGWQGDLIDRGNNVVAYLPFAQQDGKKPLRGRVRQEFNPMAEGILSMGVSAGAERGQDVQPIPYSIAAPRRSRDGSTSATRAYPYRTRSGSWPGRRSRTGRSAHAIAYRPLHQGWLQAGLDLRIYL